MQHNEKKDTTELQDYPLNGINIPRLAGLKRWNDIITDISLSNQNVLDVDDIIFPYNLIHLDLSNNKLAKVSNSILKLVNIKTLNISYNQIKCFDETPAFLHRIEVLNISNNNLAGPPYWIWVESAQLLNLLDLSSNHQITNSFKDGYFDELLQHTSPLTELRIFNCKLKYHFRIFETLQKLKTVELGSTNVGTIFSNYVEEFPCQGLNKCCDIEKINLCSVHLYNINSSIDMYKKLVEINLSHNNLKGLPNEFCNLVNLKVCLLSYNYILYLPDNIVMMKLTCLRVDNNDLCMIPEGLGNMPLVFLDLYNNNIYDRPEEISSLTGLDLAQNYFEEPTSESYLYKRQKLRIQTEKRIDGKKIKLATPESEHSPFTSEDESSFCSNRDNIYSDKDSISSIEDWDSDDYWIPHDIRPAMLPQTSSDSRWIYFVKQKMEAGHFCPADMHIVPVVEQVKYEKSCYPQVEHESDGQFDDYSSDNS